MENNVKSKISPYSVVIFGALSAVLTIPVFIFLYKYVPAIELNLKDTIVRLDHIILFLLLFFILFYLLKKLRLLVLVIVFTGAIALTVTNFTEIYTVEHLYRDYSALLFDLSTNTVNQKFLTREIQFLKEDKLRSAIDYSNPEVRNFAVNIASKHFEKDRRLSNNLKWVHFFSVFKEINSNWTYIFDPKNEEYYSKASETIGQFAFNNQFKGDCDDHSILMAACIRAVGGEVRLVKTKVIINDSTQIGHIYPEVKFGTTKDLESVVYLIKKVFFIEESKSKHINYYQDPKGFIWLNFDYNDNYPGGKYQSNIREKEFEI